MNFIDILNLFNIDTIIRLRILCNDKNLNLVYYENQDSPAIKIEYIIEHSYYIKINGKEIDFSNIKIQKIEPNYNTGILYLYILGTDIKNRLMEY